MVVNEGVVVAHEPGGGSGVGGALEGVRSAYAFVGPPAPLPAPGEARCPVGAGHDDGMTKGVQQKEKEANFVEILRECTKLS